MICPQPPTPSPPRWQALCTKLHRQITLTRISFCWLWALAVSYLSTPAFIALITVSFTTFQWEELRAVWQKLWTELGLSCCLHPALLPGWGRSGHDCEALPCLRRPQRCPDRLCEQLQVAVKSPEESGFIHFLTSSHLYYEEQLSHKIRYQLKICLLEIMYLFNFLIFHLMGISTEWSKDYFTYQYTFCILGTCLRSISACLQQ